MGVSVRPLVTWYANEMEIVYGSNPNEYELRIELSSCCFGIGTVYLAKHVPSQKLVAVKKFQIDIAKGENGPLRVSMSSHCVYLHNSCEWLWM